MASAAASIALAEGNEAFVMGDFQAAVAAYSKAVEAGSTAAQGRRGAAHLHMKAVDAAM